MCYTPSPMVLRDTSKSQVNQRGWRGSDIDGPGAHDCGIHGDDIMGEVPAICINNAWQVTDVDHSHKSSTWLHGSWYCGSRSPDRRADIRLAGRHWLCIAWGSVHRWNRRRERRAAKATIIRQAMGHAPQIPVIRMCSPGIIPE